MLVLQDSGSVLTTWHRLKQGCIDGWQSPMMPVSPLFMMLMLSKVNECGLLNTTQTALMTTAPGFTTQP